MFDSRKKVKAPRVNIPGRAQSPGVGWTRGELLIGRFCRGCMGPDTAIPNPPGFRSLNRTSYVSAIRRSEFRIPFQWGPQLHALTQHTDRIQIMFATQRWAGSPGVSRWTFDISVERCVEQNHQNLLARNNHGSLSSRRLWGRHRRIRRDQGFSSKGKERRAPEQEEQPHRPRPEVVRIQPDSRRPKSGPIRQQGALGLSLFSRFSFFVSAADHI